ncbi:hypothetical protein JCM15519_07360 [Fundidesulfovibrio butyratiphilus]
MELNNVKIDDPSDRNAVRDAVRMALGIDWNDVKRMASQSQGVREARVLEAQKCAGQE